MDDSIPNADAFAALLARAGIDASAGDLRSHPRSGRNRLARVGAPDGTRWIVKETTAADVRPCREAWFYAHAAARFGAAPACLVADDETATVVIEDVPAARTLLDLAIESPSRAVAELHRLAGPLARLHSLAGRLDDAPSAAAALPELDPIPLDQWFFLPPAARRAVQVIQGRGALTGAYTEVRSRGGPAGLVHGDLKLDNVLVTAGGPLFIDWELCGMGPVAWDLGSVVGSALVLWSDGLDADPETEEAEWVRAATLPFGDVSQALRRFVRGYLDALPADRAPPPRDEVARHAAAWMAARTWADACLSIRFTGRHHLRLLVAENLLRSPEEAFGDLRW